MKLLKKSLVFLLGFAMVLTLFAGTTFAEEAQPDPSAAAQITESETAAETETEGITDPGLPTATENAEGTASEGIETPETSESVSEPQTQEETSADADTQKEEDAEEAEFGTGTLEISGAVSVAPTFAGTDDNDELLMDYIDVSLGTSTEAAYSAMSVGKRLEGAERNAYTVLKSWAAQIAKGEIISTITELTKEQLGLKEEYTKEDLGVSDLGMRGNVSQEAQTALSKVVPSLARVNAALLFDNPYDLFWYDKSTNGAATYAYSIEYTYNKETNEIISVEIPKMIYRFAVAAEYANTAVGKTDIESGDQTYSNYYTLDKSKLSTVQTALNTIQEIVDANASKGAYEKLKAYKDKIDELVDYHETAMQDKTMPYGNPWQLIWVFDKDPATKVVCEGYSKAFQYLFDLSSGMSGIDCRIVTGPMDGGTGAGPHMWNLVSMTDGKNYLVDVTNCDNGMIGYPDNLFLVGVNYDSATNKYARAIGSRTITYQYDKSTAESYTSEELALSSTDYDPSVEPKIYTVTFVDENGAVLKEATAYPEGTKAADIAKPADPTKAADAQYTYTFAGWTPEIKDVTGDAIYTATYNKTVNQYTVTWKNDDGTVLKTEKVPYGTKAADITKPADPTKAASAQYTYTFAGWTPEIADVTGDATYMATYDKAVNQYTVTWKNEDGTVLKTEKVAYGTKPSYTGTTPTKAASAQYTYTFAGWTPEITDVTGDATYMATYDKAVNQYTVTWKNEDGTVLKTEKVAYGTKPSYTGTTPTKAASAQYTYTFAGWTPEIKDVTGDVTYMATYNKTVNQYTVTWKYEDGTVLGTEKYDYGATPEYKGDTPKKADTQGKTYSFSGWSPAITAVKGDTEYTAIFTEADKLYTVIFVDEDGKTVLKKEQVAYGTKAANVAKPIDPTKAASAQYTYTFAGWTPEIKDVTEDATYTATYNKTVNQYTVTWKNDDGTVLGSEKYDYGATPEYKGETPKKKDTQGKTFSFKGWSPEITAVTGNTEYTAAFTEADKMYTVTWKNEDGTVLKTEKVAYGTKPSYSGTTPTKSASAQYTYTFAGWTPKITDVTGDATYTATYTAASKGPHFDPPVPASYTGLKQATDRNWYYLKNGKVDLTYNGVVKYADVWWKVTNGKVDFGFTGFERNENGWWYLENGRVSFSKNALIKGMANNDQSKAGEDGWWLVRGSRVQNTNTIASIGNVWWKVTNGKVDFGYNGVANNENGWWYVKNGRVDFGFTGFERNANGWWYLENGKVSFSKNGLIYGAANNDQSKAGEDGWWLVRGSRVQNTNTIASIGNVWWKVTNGKVDFGYNGVTNNENGWWYLKNGRVDFTYNGFGRNANGWWYLENGKVSFSKNGLIYGAANNDQSKAGEVGWWLVQGSRVQNTNTVASIGNVWWKVTNGKVDFGYTGIANNDNGYWKITNGKVDFSFKGFERNDKGWWYLENGKVDFGRNDVISGKANNDQSKAGEDGWWLVRGGCVKNITTVAQNAKGWWYVKNGKVDFTYNGIGENENGMWKIENGGVNFGYFGFEKNESGWWYLENGKVSLNKNEVIFGKIKTDPTKEVEEDGWWYVKDGRVDFTYNGLGWNAKGWWKCKDGKVDFDFTGEYDGKMIINGKVQV